MAYKVVDIYKDLPRTNCGECGKPSCFAFASAVYLEAYSLECCPHLGPAHRGRMQARLVEGLARGEGRRPASSEQALRSLLENMRDADLSSLAERAATRFVAAGDATARPIGSTGPALEGIMVRFLGEDYLATRDDVVAFAGPQPSHWVKIFILIYLTRASGRDETGEWVSYRSLPNTVSKAASFEACAARIAEAFSGDLERLTRAVTEIGGVSEAPGSADRAFDMEVLPRVHVLLLVWDEQEEFPARASILVDRGVLDYLDQEALVFMAEALAARLLGEALDQVVG